MLEIEYSMVALEKVLSDLAIMTDGFRMHMPCYKYYILY